MNKLSVILVMTFVLMFANSLKAQYIIEQIEYEIPINYELLPEGTNFEDPVDEAKFFLNLSEKKLKESAYSEYEEIDILKSTIYIGGDNFAVESQSKEDGKITVILNYNTGMMYYVIWSQKKVFEMSKDDMENIQEEANTSVQKMLAQLSPEMREQAKLAMEQKSDLEESKQDIVSTGKKMTKYGYKCEQYMITGDHDVMTIWASADQLGLAKKAQSVSEKLTKIFPTDDQKNKDEWELVSGSIPIEVRTYQMDPMAGARMEIQAITKINKTNPPAEKFIAPGEAEGFTRSSFKEMMNQMMQGKRDN
ncbi:DUF4412 domain-containing protein [Ancylomarina sp. YFZ004]